MLILDTNVVSELMRQKPDLKVKQWLGAQKSIYLGLTTITIAEINSGLQRLPAGKRRTALEENFELFVSTAFTGRVFSFDEHAANCYGELAFMREQAGLHVEAVDLMIVAISKAINAKIATRNIKDFKGCGVELVNPWEYGQLQD
jgi:predicted nucleic acid-binding protein